MFTYEELSGFLKNYQESLDKYQQLTDSLLLPSSHEEWMNILKERSDVIRETFARNEEWFPKIYADLEHMTLDKAKDYYKAVVDILYVGYVYFDFPFAIDILERLLPVLKAEDTIPYRLSLYVYAALVYMYSTYYDVMMGPESRGDGLKYAEKMTAWRNCYGELADDDRAKRQIWVAYCSLLGALAEIYEFSFETLSGWYDEMISFWESDTVQRIDGNNEEIICWMERAKNAFLNTSYKIMSRRLKYADRADYKYCLKDVEEKLQPILEECVSDAFDDAYCCRCLLDIVNGKKDAGELVYQTADILEACDFDGVAQKSHAEIAVLIIDFSLKTQLFWDLLGMADLAQNEKQRLADRVSRLFFRNMRELPSTFEKEVIDKAYEEFFCEVLPYLGTFREKKDMLEKLITSRQPQTFIHSYMVEKLAVMAADAIIEKAPGMFADIPGYETAERVLARKEEFLDYVGNCGAFHDIGKCEIAGVINMQMHKVTDMEFACIKRHPWCGVKALEDDADFAPYIPVILGHHKTYDGTRGYPADFDVLSSPYKPVIDLISICDSLDAATDQLGRNYNKAKTFDVVLEEFRQGAGTRYNPDIVKVIEEDAALQEKMRHLVTDGRADAYFEAYRQCQRFAEMTI